MQVNNILIVNLAVSDLLLCTFVSPFTLVEILYKRWSGPHVQVLCQLSGMLPACVTFVSTLTITGIAIDRYKVIVYSPKTSSGGGAHGGAGGGPGGPTVTRAVASLFLIWGLSALLSSPLLFAKKLDVLPMPRAVVEIVHAESVAYCGEEWGEYEKGRLVYSVFVFVVQVRSIIVRHSD